LHGLAPAYLAETLNCAADVESRQRLHSQFLAALLVIMTGRCTVSYCTFLVMIEQPYNSLSTTLTSQSSVVTFK